MFDFLIIDLHIAFLIFSKFIAKTTVKHKDVFFLIDEQKRKIGKAPARTTINGDEIYPEKGDRDIMSDAASIAAACHADIGSVLVATRDSDFRLVSRALEEEFGFGVVGDAQQLNDRVL